MAHKVGIHTPATERFPAGFVRFVAALWVVARYVEGLVNGCWVASAGSRRERHGATVGCPHTESGATIEAIA